MCVCACARVAVHRTTLTPPHSACGLGQARTQLPAPSAVAPLSGGGDGGGAAGASFADPSPEEVEAVSNVRASSRPPPPRLHHVLTPLPQITAVLGDLGTGFVVAALRAHGGSVETTMDLLLRHQTEGAQLPESLAAVPKTADVDGVCVCVRARARVIDSGRLTDAALTTALRRGPASPGRARGVRGGRAAPRGAGADGSGSHACVVAITRTVGASTPPPPPPGHTTHSLPPLSPALLAAASKGRG